MFEDVKKEDEKIVLGDPNKVEDVFNEVDPTPELKNAMQGGKIVPRSSAGSPSPGAGPGQSGVGPPKPLTNLKELEEWGTKKSRKGVIMAAVILILVLGVVSVGAYYYFSVARQQGENLEPAQDIDAMVAHDTVPDSNTNEQTPPEDIPPRDEADQVRLIDADLDGLTDLEEQSLGTNPEDPDSDSDGLSDRDEVRVHKTNPLSSDTDNDGLSDRDEIFSWITDPNNPDTDGDSYRDGAEVDNGYDPNGPGRLTPVAQ